MIWKPFHSIYCSGCLQQQMIQRSRIRTNGNRILAFSWIEDFISSSVRVAIAQDQSTTNPPCEERSSRLPTSDAPSQTTLKSSIQSPEITTWAYPIMKMVKSHDIPHNDLPPRDLRCTTYNWVAILTYPKVFHYPYFGTRNCTDQPKCQSKLLTVSH